MYSEHYPYFYDYQIKDYPLPYSHHNNFAMDSGASGDEREITSMSSYTTQSLQSDDFPLENNKIQFKTDLTIIERLKFQNTVYQAGDHIELLAGHKENKQIFGKILMIGSAPQADFPLILVSWHYSKHQGFEEGEVPGYLAQRELVASNHRDWQYVESIKRKIKVLNLDDYESLDYREREGANIYFMRSFLDKQEGIPVPAPRIVCHCLKPYNPDEKLKVCAICYFEFHSTCARHDNLCGLCQ